MTCWCDRQRGSGEVPRLRPLEGSRAIRTTLVMGQTEGCLSPRDEAPVGSRLGLYLIAFPAGVQTYLGTPDQPRGNSEVYYLQTAESSPRTTPSWQRLRGAQ